MANKPLQAFQRYPLLARLVEIAWAGVICILLLHSGVGHAATSAGPAKHQPLVMENAERMEGSRSAGDYVLSGAVRFRHGDLVLETERAIWNREAKTVWCESGMKIHNRGKTLTAQRGHYNQGADLAHAEGNVVMVDSSGEVSATGRSLTYHRGKNLVLLEGNPVLRRFYFDTTSTEHESTDGKGAAGMLPGRVPRDTLTVSAQSIRYNDSSRVAVASRHVRIQRGKLDISADSATLYEREERLLLVGQPVLRMENNTVTGGSMRITFDGEALESLAVNEKAKADYLEPAGDTSSARRSEVQGDSLFARFLGDVLDSLEVFRSAEAKYVDLDRPEAVNRLSGDFIRMLFTEGRLAGANVVGAARTTYYHYEKQKLKGENSAEGRALDAWFEGGELAEVVIHGRAKGIFNGHFADDGEGSGAGRTEAAGSRAN